MDTMRRLWRHRRNARPIGSATPAAPVGNDGLTDSERLESLVRFRAHVGARPALTPDFQARAETVSEKLAGSHHRHVRR
ncbi:hypothetical protein GCM10027273_44880 [Nocardioides pakistanensis]